MRPGNTCAPAASPSILARPSSLSSPGAAPRRWTTAATSATPMITQVRRFRNSWMRARILRRSGCTGPRAVWQVEPAPEAASCLIASVLSLSGAPQPRICSLIGLVQWLAGLVPQAVVKKSNLAVRMMTAAVAAPVILSLLFLGPAWGWYALVLAATALASQESFAMTHAGDRAAQGLGVIGTLLLSLGVYFGVHEPKLL